MFDNKFLQSLSFDIKLTKNKLLLVAFPHIFISLLSTLLFAFDYLQLPFFLLATIVVTISLVYFTRMHLIFSSSNSVYRVLRKTNDNWSLGFKTKTIDNLVISDTSFSSNFLIICNFTDSLGQNFPVIITADSIDTDAFRRLKVLIKTRKGI